MAATKDREPKYSDLYNDPTHPLDCSSDQIRLIHILPGEFEDEIRCGLHVEPFEGAKYAALSYTWRTEEEAQVEQEASEQDLVRRRESALGGQIGKDNDSENGTCHTKVDEYDLVNYSLEENAKFMSRIAIREAPMTDPDPPQARSHPAIRVNGVIVPVMENLHEALIHLRHEVFTRVFWIDYICINQDNEQDRSGQVQRMGSIFRSASLVVAWLGPNTDDIGVAVEFLIGTEHDNVVEGSDPREPWSASRMRGLQAMEELFSRSWWTRIWVVQEMVLARRAFVQLGSLVIAWANLNRIEMISQTHHSYDHVLQKYGHEMLWAKLSTDNGFHKIQLLNRSAEQVVVNEGITMATALDVALSRECSDQRDRIFGMLGIIRPDDKVVEADYSKSTASVFEEVTFKLIQATGSLELMYAVKEFRGEDDVKLRHVASWAPRWNRRIHYSWRSRHATGQGQAQVWTCGSHVMHALGRPIGRVIAADVGEVAADFGRKYQAFKRWEHIAAAQKSTTKSARGKEHLISVDDQSSNGWQTFWLDLICNMTAYAIDLTGNNIQLSDYDYWKSSIEEEILQGQSFFLGPERSSEMASNKDEVLLAGVARKMDKAMEVIVAHNSFFVTDSGHMGVGWQRVATRGEYWVFVLAGGREPFVLRSLKKPCPHCGGDRPSYEFVGPAYVYGIMDGEAVGDIESGEAEWEDVCLV